MRILVVAPHPDDEVLGCGGTIAKYVKQGDQVYLCIVTKGWSLEMITNDERQTHEASEILGIEEIHWLNFPAAMLDTIPQKELNEAILNYIKEVKPSIVFIPHKGDIHRDHKIVFDACMVAVRPMPDIAFQKVACYEALSETEWSAPTMDNAFLPNWYVNITDTFPHKAKAMEAYETELKPFPHPRSIRAMTNLAELRGSTIGVTAAEAFMVVREITR